MKLRCISVGKPADAAVQSLQSMYEKRLSRWTSMEWVLLPHKTTADLESSQILQRISDRDYVILLDERGVLHTTEQMTILLDGWIDSSRPLTFVIGGAFGVTDTMRKRADFVWSLSPLVFPHQLVRVLLCEQLYRLFNVRAGGKYHHK
jgi:23S rRNA (pseudouridine1915-N3)-methyltransferase